MTDIRIPRAVRGRIAEYRGDWKQLRDYSHDFLPAMSALLAPARCRMPEANRLRLNATDANVIMISDSRCRRTANGMWL